MASIDYPCRLPGVLVNSNALSPKNVVRRNDLQSGPPLFIREDDDAYVMFNVAWKFSAIEMQVFSNWFKGTLARGSKLFNIDLMIDGFDGIKQTKTHECYFDGVYQQSQTGKRWTVTATLLSIQEETLGECDAISLVNAFNGFDYPLDQAILDLDGSIKLMEDLWLP
jgi:hypothetical protein